MTEPTADIGAALVDGCLRLTLNCDIVASSVRRLRSALQDRLSKTVTVVVLDLSRVRQIDSLCVSLVVGLFKTCTSKGQGLSVVGVSPDIAQVLRLFTLDKYFSITEE